MGSWLDGDGATLNFTFDVTPVHLLPTPIPTSYKPTQVTKMPKTKIPNNFPVLFRAPKSITLNPTPEYNTRRTLYPFIDLDRVYLEAQIIRNNTPDAIYAPIPDSPLVPMLPHEFLGEPFAFD